MKKLIILFFVSFLFSDCLKLEDVFPGSNKSSYYLDYMSEKTTIGNNTFGCYEDGRLIALQGIRQEEGTSYEGDNWLGWYSRVVYASQVIRNGKYTFQMILHPPKGKVININCGKIKFGINRCEINRNYPSASKKYRYCETIDSVNVNITYLNESEHIACGEFDKIILYNKKDKNNTITLTDGWFDVKYGVIEYGIFKLDTYEKTNCVWYILPTSNGSQCCFCSRRWL